ncbi:translation initiation factor IF-2 [Candidatus Kaiserbacteria bacterium]|nr:translation initiation factor IF-2 [Candidatus Kaiserbacteria bacterium]
MANASHNSNSVPRPPIVVVMGHIDHGKSTLLDYIRKTNVVEGEAGGITQRLSAYVVEHTTKEGETKKITFLDTPGHEAFQKMRLRGADVADVAILVVSAEDAVMPQTLEALASIKTASIPYIVAINKIDKPSADIARTQASLIEHEIYIEGMGGDVPWVAISAKVGTGVAELLDVLLLAAELAELKGDENASASGKVIEAHLDQKRGTHATLLITDGRLKGGQYVVSGRSIAPVRIMEDFRGKSIKEAGLSEPVGVVGWNSVPKVGARFMSVASKKEAEAAATEDVTLASAEQFDPSLPLIPILVKVDRLGTGEAIEHELGKLKSERVQVRVIDKRVGSITASDVQNIQATDHAIIVGFNVPVERGAADLAERLGVEIKTFSVIYELSEWLEAAIKARTPETEVERRTGRAKILKTFSVQKNVQVLGGRVEEGMLAVGNPVKITRRDMEIGRGKVQNLQQQKADVQSVSTDEFGMQISSTTEIAAGDYIEAFTIETV